MLLCLCKIRGFMLRFFRNVSRVHILFLGDLAERSSKPYCSSERVAPIFLVHVVWKHGLLAWVMLALFSILHFFCHWQLKLNFSYQDIIIICGKMKFLTSMSITIYKSFMWDLFSGLSTSLTYQTFVTFPTNYKNHHISP